MKKIFLSLVSILTVCLLHAQSFGVISYTLPEGWTSRPSGNDIEFTELWALKTKSINNKLQKAGIPVKTESDGWISISASKTSGNNTEGFYTLCDSSITAIILTQIPGGACIKEIQSILASINIPLK